MAQDEIETTIATDVVNQYIWRGQDLGNVALQPTLGVAYKGLSLTAWGSVGLTDSNDTKEFDLTLAYTAWWSEHRHHRLLVQQRRSGS